MYKAASFFSGIGGLDLAFAWAGFDIRLHVEIDDYCCKVLEKNNAYWPNAKQLKDIRNVTGTDVGNVSLMFGGFPCQDISIAGKRKGITEQTRSGLWFEFLRLIREVRPSVVVLENVAAVHVPTRDSDGNEQPSPGLVVAASLSEVGYDAIWVPVRASDIGAPHQRERWFCVAYRASQRQQEGCESHAQQTERFGISDKTRRAKLDNANRIGRHRAPIARQGSRYQQRNAKNRQRTQKSLAIESASEMGNAGGNRLQGWSHDTNRESQGLTETAGIQHGKQLRTESRLGGTVDGLSCGMDRHNRQWPARPNQEQYDYEPRRVTDRKENRVARIKALGNAVVPQQALPIAMAVKAFLDQTLAA